VIRPRITLGYGRRKLTQDFVEIDYFQCAAAAAGQVEGNHEIGDVERMFDVAASGGSGLGCPVDG
jgi:hypothetical protein